MSSVEMREILQRLSRRWISRLLIIGLALLSTTSFILSNKAAPLAGPSVSVNPDSGLAGSKVTVSGSGFTGGYSAIIRWDGADKKTITMSPNGTFSTTFTIPAGAAPGPHTISVCNNCGGKPEEIASVGFKVIAPPTSTPRPTTTPPPKPTDTPRQTTTPTKSLPPSICGDLGLGPQAKVLTFDLLDYRGPYTYMDTLGVRFEGSLEIESPPVEPHSGEFAARSIVGEFGSAMQPINMSFSRPLQAVGMFVGIDRPEKLDTGISAILTVFGYRGGEGDLVELGLDWIIFPPGPADIVHCLSFTAEEGDLIARAQLEYIDGEGSSAFETRWMDDLTIVFTEEGRLPENLPPVVRITSPEPDVTITDEEIILLRAEIIEDLALFEVRYMINDVFGPLYVPTRSDEDPTLYYFRINLLAATNLIPDAVNTITVTALDTEGQFARDTIQVKYLPPPALEEPEIVPGTEPLDVDIALLSLTQHGPFDTFSGGLGFQDFLVASKDAMLRADVDFYYNLFLPAASVDSVELITTHEDGTTHTYPGLTLDSIFNTFDEGGPFTNIATIYFYIPGEDLKAGEYQFDLHFLDPDYEDTIIDIGPARFHTIPPQFHFYQVMEVALDSTDTSVFNNNLNNMSRIYPVPAGVIPFSTYTDPSSDDAAGIVYVLSPGEISLPRGYEPGSSTYDPLWDFIQDDAPSRIRLKLPNNPFRIDCNGDGVVNDDDPSLYKLFDDDGDGSFDLATPLRRGQLLHSLEPEDLNDDGTVSEDELALFVRSFKDVDGDGRWYDYRDTSARSRFSAGDPFLFFLDENGNCRYDHGNATERDSRGFGLRRYDIILNYMKRQAQQAMEEFIASNSLPPMITAALVSGGINVLLPGSCGHHGPCFVTTAGGGNLFAHEFGHGWSLNHAFSTGADGIDTIYSWIPAGAVDLSVPRWVPEARASNIMGYRGGTSFLSRRDFECLFHQGRSGWDFRNSRTCSELVSRELETQASLVLIGARFMSRPVAQETERSFALFGMVSREDEVSIWNSYIIDRPAEIIPEPGDYSLVFLDQGQGLLSEVPFGVSFEGECVDCPDEAVDLTGSNTASIFVISPFPDGTANVEVRHGDQILRTLTVSASAPVIELIEPAQEVFPRDTLIEIRWQASDPDGDVLIYTLSYSTDGGAIYIPIATSLKGTTFSWDPAIAPGSMNARLRVTASDGFHTASAESDVFTLEPSVPSIQILHPEAGAVFGHRALIGFEAAAFDLEDGTLGVVWKDEEGNVVGLGSHIVLEGYEIGNHTFTANAMDRDGNEVHASISFEVVESPSPGVEGEKSLPGEIFVDQPRLSVPTCTPNEATFTAYISDPEVAPVHAFLLVSPSDEAPMITIPMERDELGLYIATLEVEENAPAGEWRYAVVVQGKSGTNYRSELGVLPVNACGVEVSESTLSDQLLEIFPYLAIGLLVVAVVGLVILAVLRSRAHGRRT